MVFSLCDVGPAGRMHPGTEQAPNSRHRRREFGTKALRTSQLEQRCCSKEVVVREGIRVREISKEEGQRLLRRPTTSSSPYVPFRASWLNRIEAQFTALRYFALDGTDQPSHLEQARMIRRYIAWRNRHADNQALRELVKRANVA
jgi:hypothetical protein